MIRCLLLHSPSRAAQSAGSVLIAVLWACLGLVSVTLLFGHSMLMTYRGADNDLSGRQADHAIEGTVRYLQSLIADLAVPGEFPEITTYESEALQIGEATVWLLGRPADLNSNAIGTRAFGLVDEAAKLNLNTATRQTLENLPGITDELAASIIDWRDANQDASDNGAESETYARREPPYVCKNAPFESIEELALVHGATREILYGEDANLNGVLDPNEDDGTKTPPSDNGDGKLDPGILEHVTVFSREPSTDPEGNPRIDVSASPLPAELWTKLETILSEEARQQVRTRVGQDSFRSVLQFYIRTQLSAQDFDKLSPYLTVDSQTEPRSWINVNTASETVLASIPAIGPTKAAELVSARLQTARQTSDITWLTEALGQSAEAIAEFLTISTYQFTADVAAVGRHGRGYRRARLVIDSTTGKPRIIYRRNLSQLGWALGPEIRQNLAQSTPLRLSGAIRNPARALVKGAFR